jgi:hypothetical protein
MRRLSKADSKPPKHLARTVHDLYFEPDVRGIPAADHLESLQRVPVGIQGTGSPKHGFLS